MADSTDYPSASLVCKGLAELLCGYQYAKDTDREIWTYAVGVDELRALGLSLNDLRWLICGGYVTHMQETTQRTDHQRIFERCPNMRFTRESCFVLTRAGVDYARELLSNGNGGGNGGLLTVARLGNADGRHAGREAPPVPEWDSARRELHVAGRIVKRFRLRSPNQEIVLTAFQEEQWPPMIHDPLPPHKDQDSKRRLQDTLKGLNRNQVNHLIRFRGDGTGEGILWELAEGLNGESDS